MANNGYVSKEVASLMGLIDTYRKWAYSKEHEEGSENRRSYESYHPSEWGKCLRLQQYKHYTELGLIQFEVPEFSSTQLRLFDKGHNMHNRWSSYFDGIGNILRGRWRCKNLLCWCFGEDGNLKSNLTSEFIDQVYSDNRARIYGNNDKGGAFKPTKCICGCSKFDYLETEVVDKDLNFKGRADVVIDCSNLDIDRFEGVRSTFNLEYLPKNGERITGDMNTIGSRSWGFQLEKRGPHKPYLIQLTIYAYILDCDYGVLMYENKDNSEMKWYKVEKNDEWWDLIKWQSHTMQDMVKDRKLPPPRPTDKSTYDCKGCEFKKLCHKSGVWKDPNLGKKRRDFYGVLL